MENEDPLSPETKAAIDAYTASKEPQETQDFFGRRWLRIINGQDPEKQPDKFTPLAPVVRVADVWRPTSGQRGGLQVGRGRPQEKGPPQSCHVGEGRPQEEAYRLTNRQIQTVFT